MKRIIFYSILLMLLLTCKLSLGQVVYNASNYHQFNTNYGYIQIGAGTSAFSFINTDKTYFLFNKPIRLRSPIISSYTGDLSLQYMGETRLRFSSKGSYFTNTLFIPYNTNIMFGAESVKEDIPRLRLLHSGVHAYIDYQDNLYFRANKNWISSLTLWGNETVGVGFGTGYEINDYRNVGYKLAVNGGIICEEVKIILDVPDADYVFEEDYNLPSLKEVEFFIKENKHLPNVPSAEEFKVDGYKVGEMDEILLRKIEEMTLYIINLQKQIDELKKKGINYEK